MYDLNRTLKDQEDLSILCQDRKLNTNEIFVANSFYGINQIIKCYTGLKSNYKLRAVLPHGVCLSAEYLWEVEKNTSLPVIFVFPEYRKDIYLKETNKYIVSIASPFLYLKSMLDNEESVKVKRKGTIFFPSHSTHHITAEANYKGMAEKLASLDDVYQPITICIYWKDYLLGYHKEFEKKGFDIISCGHMFDPKFLYRFYHLTRMYKYASSNNVGSHLFYSMALGCTFFLLKGMKNQSSAISKKQLNDAIKPNAINLNLYKLFSDVVNENTQEQKDLVSKYLCSEMFLSADELREQIIKAEKIDKYGVVFNAYGKSIRIAFPFFYFRMIKSTYVSIRKYIAGLV